MASRELIDAAGEYARSLELLRHYAAVQFAQLSLFVAVVAGAVGLLYRADSLTAAPFLLLCAKIAVAIVLACLWVAQESHMYCVAHLLRRAASL